MVQLCSPASSNNSSSSLSNMKAKSDSKVTKQYQQKGAGALTKAVRESKGAGSRRIFAPIFKLQVLDSYYRDADCMGNQRATARKYGIHRRQIQKWLQMEANLRLSVQQQQSNVVTSSTTTTSTAAALNLSPTRQPDATASTTSTFVACNTKSPHRMEFAVPSSDVDMDDSLADPPVCDNSSSDVEEDVNVDEISDTEEEEVGEYEEEDSETSSSSVSNEEALDFTCATLSRQRVYTDNFKRQVLDFFYTYHGNHRATVRTFGIDRLLLQEWLDAEQQQQQQQKQKVIQTSEDNYCLDLSSYKREVARMSKRCLEVGGGNDVTDDAQESALCLVKNEKMEPFENNNENKYHHHHHIVHPSPIDYLYNGGSYLSHDYPLYVYQPWHYQPISGARTAYDYPSKHSYSLNLKYETSYVNIPVQFGFGDSVPPKWFVKDHPLYYDCVR